METPATILESWFGTALNGWLSSATEYLALSLHTDQFLCNIYRDTPQSFAWLKSSMKRRKANESHAISSQYPLV